MVGSGRELLLCLSSGRFLIYALVAGGGPERLGAIAYALSVAATHMILSDRSGRWQNVELGVFIVDVLTFAAFCLLALRANRYWPLWVSAFLGLGVLGHIGRWAGPDLFWWAYAVMLTIWSYPILALIAIGIWNHQRRLKRFGTDPSWTNSSDRSDRPPPTGPTG